MKIWSRVGQKRQELRCQIGNVGLAKVLCNWLVAEERLDICICVAFYSIGALKAFEVLGTRSSLL